MDYRALEPGIEVNGQTVLAVVDGFTLFRHSAEATLAAEGLGRKNAQGVFELDPQAWFPQQAWLNAFQRLAERGGDKVLFNIGQKIPENAAFPPWVVDVTTAIRAVDVAYHMNHRKNGAVMFDPATSRMLEGIGHYGCEMVANNEIVSVCNNPYPCAFDSGILTAMARKFAPTAVVMHAPGGCRKNGDSQCVYRIRW